MSQLQLIQVKQPLAVAYGCGVDSTALLVEFIRRGIRPDLILFADTLGEKPETYAYLPVIQEYLSANYFPPVEIVSIKRDSKHPSLEQECLTNETLPSLAFGMKSCSFKWKVGPQNKYCNHWPPARQAWAAGIKVMKVIGYDASPRDVCRGTFAVDGRGKGKCPCCRTFPCKKYEYWYPLIEWGYDRAKCEEVIMSAGLPLPPKSACFFCPASHKSEIVWLQATHPELYERAVNMEQNFINGKHPKKTTVGLGRRFAWGELEMPCNYCGATGEVACSSTNYMSCPKCEGKGATRYVETAIEQPDSVQQLPSLVPVQEMDALPKRKIYHEDI